jgi:hypothetical protein
VITWLQAQTKRFFERLRKSLNHTRNRREGGGGERADMCREFGLLILRNKRFGKTEAKL